MAAQSEFRRAYYTDQKNFMTPHVERYGRCGGNVYELSWGENIFDEKKKFWGVTLVGPGAEKLYGMSKCFNSREEAERYIKTRSA